MNSNPPPIPDSLEAAPLFDVAKRKAALLSMALVGAVLWPISENWQADPEDSFPLSYYPMFSNRRDAIEKFWYVMGRDAEGGRHYIPYKIVGAGGGNQVRRQIRKIINEGRATELAESVAKKLARKDSERWSKIVTVQVCYGKFHMSEFFRGKKEPVSETIKGSAQVERRNS